MPDEITDSQLVKRFQRGDRDAFEQFVRRHQDRLYRLASVWLFDAQAAADATQETCLRALTGLARFRHRARPTTWLFRMLKNVCHEFNRRHERGRAAREEPQSPGPETVVGQADSIAHVRRLVDGLPDRQRDVVVLRLFEELTVAETARVMNVRPGTVKAHLSKAMANLKKRGTAT